MDWTYFVKVVSGVIYFELLVENYIFFLKDVVSKEDLQGHIQILCTSFFIKIVKESNAYHV